MPRGPADGSERSTHPYASAPPPARRRGPRVPGSARSWRPASPARSLGVTVLGGAPPRRS
eukprot:991379-Lingulodinium_polyedra.AAC.1